MVSQFFPNTNLSDLSTSSKIRQGEKQFLRFSLAENNILMLPIYQLTEVLNIPYGQIIPIPNMPSWVMGVYNWRGEILWMIDLANLVGLTPWHQQELNSANHKALVIQNSLEKNQDKTNQKILGLVVNQVEDIEWCNQDDIFSPPNSVINPELVPFLRGYWLNSQQEMITVIDGQAIMQTMRQN